MKKFFTADFHLGSEKVLYSCNRPFSSSIEMTDRLIDNCNAVAGADDVVYHIGDLYCYKRDGVFPGMDAPWTETKKRFNSIFLPLSGNHDENNGVKTVARAMSMILGGRFNCVLCHFPSYDIRSKNYLKPGDINICGHAHTYWPTPDKRFLIDKERKVLNINVGVDVWDYKPVSEVELTNYITHIMATVGRKDNKIKMGVENA